MFEIEKKEVRVGIFSLRFRNQYETCSTFLRLQEFYESPFKGIKGCVFSLEDYMDRYAKETGNFTYTTDWGGFNVPGHVIKNFFCSYKAAGEPLLNKEVVLQELLNDQIKGTDKFYVIGHYEKGDLPDWSEDQHFYSTLAHEVAHGLFYLNPTYRKKALWLVNDLSDKVSEKMSEKLLSTGGYCKSVLKDEFQAYLSTGKNDWLKEMFGLPLAKASKPFKALFRETINS
jgi:hypothetical protein